MLGQFFFIRYVLPSYQKSCITIYFQLHIISVFKIVALYFFFVYINKLLKQRPVKITGKNIKSYATAQVHFPWEREGSLTAKSPNLSFKILSASKFHEQTFFQLGPSGKIPANYANSAQFAHTVREFRKIRRFVNLFYIMFQAPSPAENPAEFQRITQIPRNSPTQSANHAQFAPFANITPYVSDA